MDEEIIILDHKEDAKEFSRLEKSLKKVRDFSLKSQIPLFFLFKIPFFSCLVDGEKNLRDKIREEAKKVNSKIVKYSYGKTLGGGYFKAKGTLYNLK